LCNHRQWNPLPSFLIFPTRPILKESAGNPGIAHESFWCFRVMIQGGFPGSCAPPRFDNQFANSPRHKHESVSEAAHWAAFLVAYRIFMETGPSCSPGGPSGNWAWSPAKHGGRLSIPRAFERKIAVMPRIRISLGGDLSLLVAESLICCFYRRMIGLRGGVGLFKVFPLSTLMPLAHLSHCMFPPFFLWRRPWAGRSLHRFLCSADVRRAVAQPPNHIVETLRLVE